MHVADIHQRPALKTAKGLLEAADLPASDLSEAHLEHFFTAGPKTAPAGLVGLDLCGPHALLRSLVVIPGLRSAGIGSALVEHAESYARARGTRSIYLLTTTAETFFNRRGYERTTRASAPAAIRNTHEFADICPATSAFMVKQL